MALRIDQPKPRKQEEKNYTKLYIHAVSENKSNAISRQKLNMKTLRKERNK